MANACVRHCTSRWPWPGVRIAEIKTAKANITLDSACASDAGQWRSHGIALAKSATFSGLTRAMRLAGANAAFLSDWWPRSIQARGLQATISTLSSKPRGAGCLDQHHLPEQPDTSHRQCRASTASVQISRAPWLYPGPQARGCQTTFAWCHHSHCPSMTETGSADNPPPPRPGRRLTGEGGKVLDRFPVAIR